MESMDSQLLGPSPRPPPTSVIASIIVVLSSTTHYLLSCVTGGPLHSDGALLRALLGGVGLGPYCQGGPPRVGP